MLFESKSLVSIIEDEFAVVTLKDGVLVTWNGSASFSVWSMAECDGSRWFEVDAFTNYSVTDFQSARNAAHRWQSFLPEDGI